MSKLIEKIVSRISKLEILIPASKNTKKLMTANDLINHPKIFLGICFFTLFAILTAVNIAFKFIINLGGLIRGSYSSAYLILPTWKLIPVYIITIFFSSAFCVFLYYKIQVNFKELNVGQKGHARFLENTEIEQRFKNIPEKEDSFDGWGGTPVSRFGKLLFIDDSVVNNIIYAITRSGKSEGLVIPTIDIISRAEKKASMIIPDVKGTLANASVEHLLKRGYEVIIYDFFEPEKSHYFNPLTPIINAYKNEKLGEAVELANAFAETLYASDNSSTKDPYWVEAPKALTVAMILALVEDCIENNELEKITPFSLFTLLAQLGKLKSENAKKNMMDIFFGKRKLLNPARLQYTTIEFSEGKTRTSVLSICISKLNIFAEPNIAKLTATNSIDLSEIGFGKHPIAVFIKVPYYTKTFNAIVSIIISQALYLNMEMAARANKNVMKRRVRVVGDEIFNFPAIPYLESNISVCLGSGWSFDLYAQSMTQVKNVYGENAAQIILDNCATTFFLASPDKDTREKISEMCGKITVENVTRAGERFSISKTITEQFEEKPLIPAQELSELTDGEMIVLPTMQRKDKNNNKAIPLPIFNKDDSAILYRHEYLREFDTDAEIPYEKLNIKTGTNNKINIENIIYVPNEAKRDEFQDTVSSYFNPTELRFITGLLPADFMADFDTLPLEELKKQIYHLFKSNMLSKKNFDLLKKTLEV